jgi:HEAT repeat protein
VDWAGTAAATAPLRAALHDSAKPIRLAALTGVRRANDAASISAVRALIDSEHDFEVLRSAMLTLGELNDPALPEFLDSLS